MQLHQLEMEGEELAMRPVWAMPGLLGDGVGYSCKVFWSPDDTWALILHEGSSPRTAYDAMDAIGINYIMHSLEINTQDVVEIAHRTAPDSQHALTPQPSFGPDGNYVLIQWHGHSYDDFDIYSHKERNMVFSVRRDTDESNSVIPTRIVGFAFAPDCSLIAIVSREASEFGVGIHIIDGQSGSELWRQQVKIARRSVKFGWWQTALLAWSPDGSQIACWLSNSDSHLCVFDAKHGHSQVSVNVENVTVNPSQGVGLLWGLYSPLPILWSVDPRNWACARSDSCSMLICGVPGNECPTEHVLVQIGNCHPALSPDRTFLAALDPEGTAVCVYDARSGICVSRQAVDIDLTRPSAVSLIWEPLARGLVAQIGHYIPPHCFFVKYQTLTVLRF